MVKVLINGQNEIEVNEGTTLLELSKNYEGTFESRIVGAMVNNEVKGLMHEIKNDCSIKFIDLTSEDGARIYRRSLAFLLSVAAHEIYPDEKVMICHSISKGLYCELRYNKVVSEDMVFNVEQKMRKMIEDRVVFNRIEMPISEAKKLFEKEERLDLIHIAEHRGKEYITLTECNGWVDCFYGYIVPDAGFLETFELKHYPPGFILRFPEKSNPSALPPFIENKKLFNIFHEYKKWGSILQVENVGELNEMVSNGQSGELIRVSEGLQEKKIAQIADLIAENPKIKVVLIAGPSSSGKTTSAQRLAVQLRVNCFRPVMISLDNYFLNRDKTPRDEFGEYDFEALEALDVELFNQNLIDLIDGKEVEIPIFNFTIGAREPVGTKMKMEKDQILIIEGIHGLNEKLTPLISKENKFKIYVSALTSLSIDEHNRIPTTDTRIIRRIVRDSQYRNHDALSTIKRWPSVRRGEEANIFTFQEEADVMFNSSMIYELSVLKTYAEPLLKVIDNTHPEYSEAKRLLNFLSYFLPIGCKEIPINSIVREFIGDGCFLR